MISHLWDREFRRVRCPLPAKVFQVATLGHTLCPMTSINLSLVQVEEFSRTMLEVILPGAFVTVTGCWKCRRRRRRSRRREEEAMKRTKGEVYVLRTQPNLVSAVPCHSSCHQTTPLRTQTHPHSTACPTHSFDQRTTLPHSTPPQCRSGCHSPKVRS